jgi:hypothetical protein
LNRQYVPRLDSGVVTAHTFGDLASMQAGIGQANVASRAVRRELNAELPVCAAG